MSSSSSSSAATAAVTTAAATPLFQFPLRIANEYFPMINDLLRMTIIQVVAQIMFYFSNPIENPFWSPMFVQTVLFLLIGVLAYWLVFRHLVGVTPAAASSSSVMDDTISLPPFFTTPTNEDVIDNTAVDAVATAS